MRTGQQLWRPSWRLSHRYLTLGLAALLALCLSWRLAQPALAATIRIFDAASCVAAGGSPGFDSCDISMVSVNAGDTLSIERLTVTTYSLDNRGTIMVISHFYTGGMDLAGLIYVDGTLHTISDATNWGTIDVRNTFFTHMNFINRGTIYLRSNAEIRVDQNFHNAGTVYVGCNVTIDIFGGSITGNPFQYADCTPPSVTINQAAAQADPTASGNLIRFEALFDEAVTGFSAADVTLSGTANLDNAEVNLSGGPTNYAINVSGVTGSGTVIATIAANVATDAAGNGNRVSTSTDNRVTLETTAPVITPNLVGPLGSNGWYVSDVTLSWTVTDAESTITEQTGCGPQNITSDTSGVNFTCAATSFGGSRSRRVTIKRDATPPLVTVTGVSEGATYPAGSAPAAGCTTTDALAGVASQATVEVTGGDGDGSGNFTATCSGATDNAGNSATVVSVSYAVAAAATSTPTATATATPTATPSATSTATATSTPTPTATSTATPGATSTPTVTPPPVTPGAVTITIVLDVQPNAVTNYGFSSSFGPFRLDDPGQEDNDQYTNSKTFLVTAGSYSFSRTPATTRDTASIACTHEDRAVIDLDANRVTLTVSGGDNITCTFVVIRSSTIRVRAFEDLVRNGTNLGKRNAGDPWRQEWSISLFSSPTTLIATKTTAATATAGLYEATFADLRPGTYILCSPLPSGNWRFTMPSTLDPNYGLPCKPITLDPGQTAVLLFGAYQATTPAMVVAADSAEAVVTDEDQIIDVPYDPAEEASVVEAANPEAASRIFLPLVSR